MSRVFWSRALTPASDSAPVDVISPFYGEEAALRGVLPLPQASTELQIPDPKAFRSMSRAAIFLSHLGMQAIPELKEALARSPFSVGIYCAVENGPIDLPSTQKMIDLPREQFAESYRKLRNPKMYLKQLPNLAAAQMGISLGIQGPLNVYTHATGGALQALDQAEFDVENGVVEIAVVCGAMSFEDPLIALRSQWARKGRTLSEGAAVQLWRRSGSRTDWNAQKLSEHSPQYGIADEIVQLAKRTKL